MVSKQRLDALFSEDVRSYASFILTTGTFRTFGEWKKAGKEDPFAAPDYRSDMVTRTQIVNIFFRDA